MFCDEFDLSNLDKNHPCHDKSHNKWFGVVKIEHKGLPIDYHIAPMVKCYVDRTNEKDEKIFKGIPKKSLEKITFEDYQLCVRELKQGRKIGFQNFGINAKHKPIARFNVKDTLKMFQPNVVVQDNYDEKNGDYWCLPLGHPDIPAGVMLSTERAKEVSNRIKEDKQFKSEMKKKDCDGREGA